MEVPLILIWSLLVAVIPFVFIALSYFRFGRETALVAILGRLFVSFVGYVGTTFLMSFVMFGVIYAGAHTKPVGNALDLTSKLAIGFLVFLYALANYFLSSFIYGRLIGIPNKTVQLAERL